MNQSPQPKPNEFKHPWLVSAWATITSIALAICGLFIAISVTPSCWVVGAYVILVAIIVAVMEAPLLWKTNQYTVRLNQLTSGLKFWHKGLFYFLLVVPVFFCFPSVSSIFAVIIILSNGMGYFVLAIGPRNAEANSHVPLEENA